MRPEEIEKMLTRYQTATVYLNLADLKTIRLALHIESCKRMKNGEPHDDIDALFRHLTWQQEDTFGKYA